MAHSYLASGPDLQCKHGQGRHTSAHMDLAELAQSSTRPGSGMSL